jgi:hypothetical protein
MKSRKVRTSDVPRDGKRTHRAKAKTLARKQARQRKAAIREGGR